MEHSWDELWMLREQVFGLLAQSFLEPINKENAELLNKDFWLQFPLEPVNEQMESGLKGMVQSATSLEQLPDDKKMEEAAVDYTSLFVGPGMPDAPPWESIYRTKDKLLFGETAFQVRDIFMKYGIESRSKGNYPEDHIGLQLMFLSIVSKLLQQADESEQIAMVKEQISFIDEHLLSWIHEICASAKANERTQFYGSLLELTWGILLSDKELLNNFLEKHN